jgi:hypothetical protein
MLKRNVLEYSRAQPVSGRAGKVFAIRIAPNRWGFIRFRGGSGFGFLPAYSNKAGMPRLNWSVDPEVWFADELSGTEKYESDGYVLAGKRAPTNPWMPDRFQRPQFSWQPWIIFRRDQLVRVNGPEDVVGLEEAVYMNPAQITHFLRQKYHVGELKPVDVDAPEPCPVDAAVEQLEREAPTIVFAKIVQPIDPDERERVYEEPLAEFLAEHDLGEITGGGTMQDKHGGVLFAGIDIEVRDPERAVPLIARKLAELGAPAGSELEYSADERRVVVPIQPPQGRGRRAGRGGK